MEIYQLRTFVTVAQQGHLTQAAALLHLSQPAVTAQIKALEEDVGMPLFERSASGIRLTRLGEDLLPRAQDILSASRDMLNHAKSLKGQFAGRIVIGTITTPEIVHIGPWVASLINRYPLIDIQIRHGVTGEILNQVRKKEIDVGFYLGKNHYVNVNSVKLKEIPMRIVVPVAWRDRVEAGGIKELGKLPWLGMSQHSSFSKLTSELWRELNIAPKRICDIDHVPVMEALVCCGIGIVLMREDDALRCEAAGRVHVVPDVVKQAELQFIYPAERAGDAIINILLSELQAEWHVPLEEPSGSC